MQQSIVLDAVRLYFEGTVAATIAALLGIISGLVTIALTGDGRLALVVAVVGFVLAGVGLTVRLWRMTRTPIPPAAPPA